VIEFIRKTVKGKPSENLGRKAIGTYLSANVSQLPYRFYGVSWLFVGFFYV
jgi:hypothetical protein